MQDGWIVIREEEMLNIAQQLRHVSRTLEQLQGELTSARNRAMLSMDQADDRLNHTMVQFGAQMDGISMQAERLASRVEYAAQAFVGCERRILQMEETLGVARPAPERLTGK